MVPSRNVNNLGKVVQMEKFIADFPKSVSSTRVGSYDEH